ncbi:hypothetical protein K7432_017051 [Basidiobolus ranarum]|uniref:Uncharacterized protein n=1 Tax=Basidiobolus ranarum TaxID=34480 RepID=A0ABR2WDV8_9FUNG
MLCIPCLKDTSQYQPLATSDANLRAMYTKKSTPPRNSSLIHSTALPYSCDKRGTIQNRSMLPRFEEMLQNDSIVRVSLTPTVAM